MTYSEKHDYEREQVELVFGLTGGELDDTPWVAWTQPFHSDGTVMHNREDDGGWFYPIAFAYSYAGPPEYAEEYSNARKRYDNRYRTVVWPGHCIGHTDPELYDSEGIWSLVETWSSSGEIECPLRSYDPETQESTNTPRTVTRDEVRMTGVDGVFRYGDDECPYCGAKYRAPDSDDDSSACDEPSEEHGFIYLGSCGYEALYVLTPQTYDAPEDGWWCEWKHCRAIQVYGPMVPEYDEGPLFCSFDHLDEWLSSSANPQSNTEREGFTE